MSGKRGATPSGAARTTASKQSKYGRAAHASGTRSLSFKEVDSNLLAAVAAAVTEDGAALLLARTSDGGAIVLQVLDGAEKPKWYAADLESLTENLRTILRASDEPE